MLQMRNPLSRAKARSRMAKARMNWNWKLGKGRARKNLWQLRARPQMQRNTRLLNAVIGGAAGLLAIFAVTAAATRRKAAESLAQSGQAPSRSHVQLSSHPAAQSRFEPVKRMLRMA